MKTLLIAAALTTAAHAQALPAGPVDCSELLWINTYEPCEACDLIYECANQACNGTPSEVLCCVAINQMAYATCLIDAECEPGGGMARALVFLVGRGIIEHAYANELANLSVWGVPDEVVLGLIESEVR